MAPPRIGYEDYIKLAEEKDLRFLHGPDELPPERTSQALWQCRVTGEVFSKSYHNVKYDPFPSHGQQYAANFLVKYFELGERLNITFLHDPTVDIAPGNTKQPVKWRNNKNDEVIVATYQQLAYDKIPKRLREALCIND